MNALNVGVLGATGAVGQKFIRLLHNHPWFSIKALGASERSAGKPYREAAHWIEDVQIPEEVSGQTVTLCEPNAFSGVDFVFSGLDSSVATDIERSFAEAGIPVISNAKNYRMFDSVPLLVPEVNPDHIELIKAQKFTGDGSGWIVTNPNCVCVPLAMSLRPIYDAYGIESVVVTSMQAVSGAGYPGVPSLDILGNAVPFIGGEEDKIHTEPLKLLGSLNDAGMVDLAEFGVQATAVRIPTVDGHMLSVTAKLKSQPSDISEVARAIEQWESPIRDLNLPSAPGQPIKLYNEDRFPQPRLHALRENGMQLGMGRLRSASVFDISFIALAHNTIRGAAGGAVLNAELLVEKGYLG
ncbi:MAG: aspartate-semialdehyde dehydrogenase [Balneolaceae bacterium]|nr:aspartate-semialdehyde dehydrogenase [Balneolaceae bacterium]